jgi:predicted transcriptional regulator
MTDNPVRPASEYGERPAGAPADRRQGAGRFTSGSERGDTLDEHRDAVITVLHAEHELDVNSIADRVALEATQVSSLLPRLQHDGVVTRTAEGRWRLTAAAEANPSH